MPKWFLYCFLTMVFWGAWGIVSKVALNAMSPLLNQVLFTLGLIPLVLAAASSKNLSAGTDRLRGATYAFITGILGGVGNITFFEALSHGGKASTVAPVTGLYPLLTVLAALPLLKERLNWVQGVGVGLAVAAILLFGAG